MGAVTHGDMLRRAMTIGEWIMGGASPLVTGSYWRQVAERAVKTAGQALVATWAVDGLDLAAADWRGYLALATSGALLSVATSLASLPLGPQGTPSLVEVRTSPPAPGRQW